MEIIKKGDFIFVVDKQKNDVNGNPKYEVIPIRISEPASYNTSFVAKQLGYKVNKSCTKVIIKSYNITASVDELHEAIKTALMA